MSGVELDSTARSLANAIPPLAHLAVAAGAAPHLVQRVTGCRVTNTSRLRNLPIDRLIDKVDQALRATNCVPLLDIKACRGVSARQALGPKVCELFADEVIEMADALQGMKYATCAELDARNTKRRFQLASIQDWDESVMTHVVETCRLSDVIVAKAQVFGGMRMRYVRLLTNGQLPWSAREPIRHELFISKHKIADELERLSISARFAWHTANQQVGSLSPAAVRRYSAALESLAERTSDHRIVAKSDRVFRRTLPTRHPLSDFLRQKPQYARIRRNMETDYQQAILELNLFLDRAERLSIDAMIAQNLLLRVEPTQDGNAINDIAIDLADRRTLRISFDTDTSVEAPPLFGVPRILVANR